MKRRYATDIRTRKKPQKTRHSKDDAISETELRGLIDKSDEHFDKILLVCAGLCGMREGEIAHLERDWIDFQNGVISIPAQKECDCADCVKRAKRIARAEGMEPTKVDRIKKGIWKPKTERGIRKIPIRDFAQPIIGDYFKINRRIGCSRQTVYNHITDTARKSGITTKIYPHSLRATAATLWGQMGISAPTLCYLMGWDSIQTALPYVKATEESAIQETKWRERQQRGV